MQYELRASDGSTEKLASADLPDHFAAETWAKEWVRSHGAHDTYRLQSTQGDFARALFKTHAGQWYMMAVPAEQAASLQAA